MRRLFEEVVQGFDDRVRAVGDDQWDAPTPCSEWSVRDLVNHVAVEDLWVPPLLEGKTISDVGDTLDGDQLGDDPAAGWTRARDAALQAASADGALEAITHLSYGDFPGAHYLAHVGSDHVVHAWDLARAVGADEDLPEEHVELVFEAMVPIVESGREYGIFGPEVQVPEGADRQTELLAIFGRRV